MGICQFQDFIYVITFGIEFEYCGSVWVGQCGFHLHFFLVRVANVFLFPVVSINGNRALEDAVVETDFVGMNVLWQQH